MSNNDLISREALKKALKDAHINMKLTFDIATFNCVMNTIDNAPTVERPQGEWKSLGFVHSRNYAWCTCSNCGKTTKIYRDKDNDFCCIADIRNKAVACLFCGADMRKGGAE